MHTRNLQALAAEMFKVHQNLSPTIVAEIFRARRKNYNLRRSSFFPYKIWKNSLSQVSEFIQLRTKNMELSIKYIEKIR